MPYETVVSIIESELKRPAIRETMENDIRLLKKASGILKLTLGTNNLIDFHTILDELWETTREEINFKKEAANLDLFYANQKEIVYTTCPVVYHELTTPRLLVMDYIDGIQIDHIQELEGLGYDMTEIGEKQRKATANRFWRTDFSMPIRIRAISGSANARLPGWILE